MIPAFPNEMNVRRLDFSSLLHTLSSRCGIVARLLSFYLGFFFLLFFFSGLVYFLVLAAASIATALYLGFSICSHE